MKKIAIIPNPAVDTNFEYSKKVASLLKENGAEVLCNQKEISNGVYTESIEEIFKKADAAITFGGDGTVLLVSELAARENVPLLGINLGHLGFLVELEKEEKDEVLKVLTGDYKTDERMRIEASVLRDNKEIYSASALNDISVAKGNIAKMVHLKLEIDDTYINDYFCDGIIFATPTGSTAYSMSAGGPVVCPVLDAMVITPICPHTFSARPMVVADKQIITVTTDVRHDEEIVLYADGVVKTKLKKDDKIIIKASKYKTKLIRTQDRNFFYVLYRKFSERK